MALISSDACDHAQFDSEAYKIDPATKKPQANDHNENFLYDLIAKAMLLRLGRDCVVAGDAQRGPRIGPDCPTAIPAHPSEGVPDAACLTSQIDSAILGMDVTSLLGSSDVPCLPGWWGSDGEYDVGLRALIWLAYEFRPSSDPNVPGMSVEAYQHLRNILLTVDGTPSQPPQNGLYGYAATSCGNHEKSQGTPRQRVDGHNILMSMCQAVGAGCSPSWPTPTKGDSHFSCGKNLGTVLLCGSLIALFALLVFFTFGAVAFAAGGVGWGLIAATVAASGGLVVAAVDLIGSKVFVPETENHILQIETARVLINGLLAHDFICQDPADPPHTCEPKEYIVKGSELFNITANRDAAWMLWFLRGIMQDDFDEYNARNYERYSVMAILNLYELICHWDCTGDRLKVRVAAREVLDYLTAKFAVSNSSLRRFVPWRRKVEYRDRVWTGSDAWQPLPTADGQMVGGGLYTGDADFLTQRSLVSQDPALIPVCPAPRASDRYCASVLADGHIEQLSGAISGFLDRGYAPPPGLAGIIETTAVPQTAAEAALRPQTVHSGCHDDLQWFHHGGLEVYYCDEAFLISSGGRKADCPYPNFFAIGCGDAKGVAVATTLMPTGIEAGIRDLIRFDGSDRTNSEDWTNLCVDRNFACGRHLIIPVGYRNLGPACYDDTTAAHWTFIDATCMRTPSNSMLFHPKRGDFYVAVYCDPAPACGPDAEAQDVLHPSGDLFDGQYGFLEAVDAGWGTFADFRARVLANNAGRTFTLNGTDTFTRLSGADVRFDPSKGKLAGFKAKDVQRAQGDLVESTGDGCVVIHSHAAGAPEMLRVLSLTDPNDPYIADVPASDAGSHDSLCTGSGSYLDSGEQ